MHVRVTNVVHRFCEDPTELTWEKAMGYMAYEPNRMSEDINVLRQHFGNTKEDLTYLNAKLAMAVTKEMHQDVYELLYWDEDRNEWYYLLGAAN